MDNDIPDLKEISNNYKIFIDTCSLMHVGSNVFFKIFSVYLSQCNEKIIVPYRVIEELKKNQCSSNSQTKRDANNGSSIIQQYNKFIEIRGEKSDPFADNLFLTIFTKFRIKHNLCLITQDKNLAKDILQLKNCNSVQTNKDINVLFLKDNGFLIEWNIRV